MSFLSLQITGKCNLDCKFCLDEFKVENHMEKDTFLKVIKYLKKNNINRVFLTGGEPLLHTDISFIIKELKRKNIRVILNSNGILVNRTKGVELVDEAIISIDSYGEELRGKEHYEKVIEGVELLISKGIKVKIASVVTKENVSFVKELEDKLPNEVIWQLRQFLLLGNSVIYKEKYNITKEKFNSFVNSITKKEVEIISNDFDYSYKHVSPNGKVLFYEKSIVVKEEDL